MEFSQNNNIRNQKKNDSKNNFFEIEKINR